MVSCMLLALEWVHTNHCVSVLQIIKHKYCLSTQILQWSTIIDAAIWMKTKRTIICRCITKATWFPNQLFYNRFIKECILVENYWFKLVWNVGKCLTILTEHLLIVTLNIYVFHNLIVLNVATTHLSNYFNTRRKLGLTAVLM